MIRMWMFTRKPQWNEKKLELSHSPMQKKNFIKTKDEYYVRDHENSMYAGSASVKQYHKPV